MESVAGKVGNAAGKAARKIGDSAIGNSVAMVEQGGQASKQVRKLSGDGLAELKTAWVECMLSRAPFFKFMMRWVSNLVLGILLNCIKLEPNDPNDTEASNSRFRFESRDTLSYCVLIWAAGGCVSEYRQYAASSEGFVEELRSFVRTDRPSVYRKDIFNVLDLITCHLIVIRHVAASAFDARCHRRPSTRSLEKS